MRFVNRSSAATTETQRRAQISLVGRVVVARRLQCNCAVPFIINTLITIPAWITSKKGDERGQNDAKESLHTTNLRPKACNRVAIPTIDQKKGITEQKRIGNGAIRERLLQK